MCVKQQLKTVMYNVTLTQWCTETELCNTWYKKESCNLSFVKNEHKSINKQLHKTVLTLHNSQLWVYNDDLIWAGGSDFAGNITFDII